MKKLNVSTHPPLFTYPFELLMMMIITDLVFIEDKEKNKMKNAITTHHNRHHLRVWIRTHLRRLQQQQLLRLTFTQ